MVYVNIIIVGMQLVFQTRTRCNKNLLSYNEKHQEMWQPNIIKLIQELG